MLLKINSLLNKNKNLFKYKLFSIEKNKNLKKTEINCNRKLNKLKENDSDYKNLDFSYLKNLHKKEKDFNFLNFSYTNDNQIKIFSDSIVIYEKIIAAEFICLSGFFFYFMQYGFRNNSYKHIEGKAKIILLFEKYNSLENCEIKKSFEEKAEIISILLKRRKFEYKNLHIFQQIRYELINERMIIRIKNELIGKKCLKCFMLLKFCICKKIQKFDFKANIYFIMHNKELLRASNTSKILNLMQIDAQENLLNLNYLIPGIFEHNRKLENLMNDEKFVENSVILYPDKYSMESKEFVKEKLILFENDEKKLSDFLRNLNIFVIDGTWSQTSNLKRAFDNLVERKIFENSFLDDTNEDLNFSNEKNEEKSEEKSPNYFKKIQSIRINIEENRNIFDSLRQSHSEEKCSTIQALGILLKEFSFDKEINNKIMENFKIFVKNVSKQYSKDIDI